MTPRSGSTFLSQHISRRLNLGHPAEYLNEGFIANFEHLFPPPSLNDFENFVLTNFTSSTGVFGLKTDWWRFKRARELNYLSRLYEDVDLTIFLMRKDLLSQTISLTISMQTGIWHDSNIQFSAADKAYENLVYDEDMLMENLRGLVVSEYFWTRHLEESPKPVIRLLYEDAIADLEAVTTEIAAALDVPMAPGHAAWGTSAMRRVPSPVNAEWKTRFLTNHQDLVESWTRQRGEIRPMRAG